MSPSVLCCNFRALDGDRKIIIYFWYHTGNVRFYHMWWSFRKSLDHYLLHWLAHYWSSRGCHIHSASEYNVFAHLIHIRILTKNGVPIANHIFNLSGKCVYFLNTIRVHNHLNLSHIIFFPHCCKSFTAWTIFWWFMIAFEP